MSFGRAASAVARRPSTGSDVHGWSDAPWACGQRPAAWRLQTCRATGSDEVLEASVACELGSLASRATSSDAP